MENNLVDYLVFLGIILASIILVLRRARRKISKPLVSIVDYRCTIDLKAFREEELISAACGESEEVSAEEAKKILIKKYHYSLYTINTLRKKDKVS